MTPFAKKLFCLLGAAALVLVLGGCAGPARKDAASPSRVRVEGARILEPDPERPVEQGVLPPDLTERAEAASILADPPDRWRTEPGPDVVPDVKVTLELVNAGADEALRGLAYQGDVDLVMAEGINRRVTVRLQDAPWVEAFRSILDGAHLVAQWEGRRVRVVTYEQLLAERTASETLETQFPRTDVVVLQNLKAKDVAATVTSVLSGSGKVGFDEEMNALVVTDTSSRVEAVRRAVARLDHAPPQVMIEAMIIDVTLNDEMHYGWDWTVSKLIGDAMTWNQALTVGAGLNAAAAPGSQVTFALTRKNWTMTGTWDFIETHDNAKVLANPKILAINNRQAIIEIIDEIPYQELTQTSAGGQIGTTSFKEVGIKLTVTPRIAADGTVHLELSAEQSSPTGAAVNQIPVIQTRRAQNVMVVDNGRTIVIGGLRRRRTITNEDKLPLMGDLLLIGGLFRRVETVEVDTELVIFITPHIVTPAQTLTGRERVLAEAIDHPDTRSLLERGDPLRIGVKKEDDRARRVP